MREKARVQAWVAELALHSFTGLVPSQEMGVTTGDWNWGASLGM